MNNYPDGSKALSVLLGFQREIRAYVTPLDQCNLSSVSWWLYRSVGAARSTAGQECPWPSDDELNALTQRLHARLARGARSDVHKRKTKARLTVAQVRVLLRDLLLVASGLRPSCLVDCCALTKELAELLLVSLAAENEPSQHMDHVRAVLLDGNVFFVNVNAFIHEKMVTGLHHQMYVDVSASLAQPTRIEKGATRFNTFAVWTISACRDLLSSKDSRILEWTRPSDLNATALAGILLCYPCVYDILRDGDDATAGRKEQENCLAMCPLIVVQTAAILPPALALLEFSVPQHLLDDRSRFNDTEQDHSGGSSLQLNLLRARCRLQLQRAIDRSCWASASTQAHVRIDTRTLHRVAL